MNRLKASLAMLALAVSACGGAQNPGREQATVAAPVRAEPAESLAVSGLVRSVGILAPRDEIRLSFKTGGVIDRLAVDAGDAVRKGQLLAVIKRGEVDAAVAQASVAGTSTRFMPAEWSSMYSTVSVIGW